MANRTDYGPNKYAAYHMIFSRWLRHYAMPRDYCYVTLGGTELRDVEAMSFIDRSLTLDAISYEENFERHGLAEQTAAELAQRDVVVRPFHGNIFEYNRSQSLPHIFFVDLEGICAWGDYYRQFGKMFQDGVIREGDALFITSYLGRNPGWNRVFDTFDGQFRILGVSNHEDKKVWYRRAHPSFTIYKGLEYANCVGELSVKDFGCVVYRDTSLMAIYGYAVAEGSTAFLQFIRDESNYFFQIKKGFLHVG